MRNKITTHTEYNSISYGSKVYGYITSDKDVRIDGEVEGTIISSGKIILGEKSLVKGKIQCESAEISGKLEGEIYVSNVLVLRETAVVTGDVQTQSLVIDSNAVFNGNCSMSDKKIKLHSSETKEQLHLDNPKIQKA